MQKINTFEHCPFKQMRRKHGDSMSNRFQAFLLASRWAGALMALMYHVRFLMFVDYGAVHEKTGLSKAFYFLTGLGHESFAVFFVADGVAAGLLLRHRAGAVSLASPAAQYLGALYRILLLALLLGVALDLTGVRFFNSSGIYTDFPAFNTTTLSHSSLLGNLLMLQPFLVPTFGSNGMLYLLSYQFWSFILLVLFLGAARLGPPLGRHAQVLLVAAVLLVMPYHFLAWGATWLAGAAVVGLGESRAWRPPVLAAIAGFVGVLVLSRLGDSNAHLLAPPFGDWLIGCKYLLVGISFAALAWALYPARSRALPLHAGPAAPVTFFCHFPVMMLFFTAGSALLARPIMQQPTPAGYALFLCLTGACVAVMALVARACSAMAAVTLKAPGSDYSKGRAPTQPTDCGD
jgi:hypothetical protein